MGVACYPLGVDWLDTATCGWILAPIFNFALLDLLKYVACQVLASILSLICEVFY